MLNDAQKKLVEENIKLAQWFAAKWRNPLIEPEDAFQIAAMGLCKAAIRYNPERGPFSTMAVEYARRELLAAAGRRKPMKVYSFDTPLFCGDGNLTIGMMLKADSNLEDDLAARQIQEAIAASSFAERRVLTLMAKGYKQHEAARLLGMSRQNVQQTIKRVKPKLYRIIAEENHGNEAGEIQHDS